MRSAIRENMKALACLLDQAQSVVLAGHHRADGDVIGTMSALYHHLASRSKSVAAFLFEPVPERYDFLGFQKHVRVFDSADSGDAGIVTNADAVVLLDASSIDRLPGWADLLEKRRGKTVRIDHHPSSSPFAVDIDITDPRASATGQLVFDYLEHCGASLSPPEALGLFTAIATDTGWFRYSNTSPHSIRAASVLLETGFDLSEVYRSIYQRNELGMLRLMGQVVSAITSEMDGRLLWGIITQDMVRDAGLKEDFDTDVLLDLLRSSKRALCVALFREVGNGTVRVNLRSKGSVPVNRIAEAYGGGGHRNAAGITVADLSPADSAQRVVADLKRLMADLPANPGGGR